MIKFKKQYRIELAPTLKSHWYSVYETDKKGKGKFVGYFASSTTILLAYPQSEHLTRWIAEKGISEAQRIKSEAGEAGTLIHKACDGLEEGYELHKVDYSLEEWNKIFSFYNWQKEYNPKTLAQEVMIFSKKGKYAGRFDRLYEIEGKNILLDFKSGGVHEHHALQSASYANAVEENTDIKVDFTAILKLGAENKNGYRYILYPREEWLKHYEVFKNVKATWQYENFGSKKNPKEAPILELPETLKL